MKNIPFINIADISCWMVYLMPFDDEDKTNYDVVFSLQEKCITRNFFGMGWKVPCFDFGTPMTDETARQYVEKYNNNEYGWTVSSKAVNGYASIRKGDYVIMRLKDNHYYVGKVSSDKAYYAFKENDGFYCNFSWGCNVEKWEEYCLEEEIPSEIVGRFSQRLHSTIQRISPYRQKMLVISMYENRQPSRTISIPKLHINEDNFVRSLNYMELEDLVAAYIDDKHRDEGYMLLPSSCKVSQQNYEFRFVASKLKPITCQVKNQQYIDIERYTSEKQYSRIYIFSGKWTNDDISALKEKYKDYPHIYLISPAELYRVLKKRNLFADNVFYTFNSNIDMPVIKHDATYKHAASEDFITFIKNDGLFYSAEFNALVLSRHILPADLVKENQYVENILNDLNEENI